MAPLRHVGAARPDRTVQLEVTALVASSMASLLADEVTPASLRDVQPK